VEGSPEEVLKVFKQKLNEYRGEHGYDPRVILIKGMGMLALGDNSQSVDVTLDVFEDLMKIAFYSEHFGGPNFMTKEDTDFIMNWEVESYRRKLIQGSVPAQLANKVAVVTGGAQGFGKGIVEGLLAEGSDVAVLDMNEETGRKTVEALKEGLKGNDVIFVRADITHPADIQRAVYETVKHFSGIDVLISNAGVLRAGSLEGLSEEEFDLVTEVNYKGFYLCTKYMSRPMKLQAAYNKDLYMDIIQINSKSGLQGSNKNFAYAGSKFGSIGLVQSFAMELVPDRIKVNAICPGNYFEGPLWSDPERGLFVQYLNAGKVPGAKTIADVKRFYEQKVPMLRGCYPEDVTRAIVYAVGQVYETGQAIPVSGGQVMLH
jgi:NAD(P)-dependent dehydrogenase (short-subunit alcohol dehydrogenase family)